MANRPLIAAEGNQDSLPDLRLLHFNDVYHVEPGSRDPVGGAARFQTLCDHYRNDPKFQGQSELLTFFSGDAFNPSLESSVTKGKHMVPILNNIGTDAACVGNHDFDLGIPQFQYLTSKCKFPWLLANVLDPSLGDDVSLANCPRTHMVTSSNGIKIGLIGIAEQEWLDTVNALPSNLPFIPASETVKKYAPQLRFQGAELIIALCHQREVNDNRLAADLPPGMVDIILGGHDHHYRHSKINGIHVLCSGTDFKQLSYIEARRSTDAKGSWDLTITRRDVTKDIVENPETVALMDKMFSSLRKKLNKPIGYTVAPLDSRFNVVRRKESNIGNFAADLMKNYLQGDCCILAGGTIRGDQIYPPGILKLKDVMDCFPFEDPTVMVKVSGKAIWDALENGVSHYPALEGRFPQVSNMTFRFDPSKPPGQRMQAVQIGKEKIDMERKYKLVTRAYMVEGGDGFSSLRLVEHGGTAESLVSDECGLLLSMILRQYFMSLKIMGKWKNWSSSLGRHWGSVHEDLHQTYPVREPVKQGEHGRPSKRPRKNDSTAIPDHDHYDETHLSDSEDEDSTIPAVPTDVNERERNLILMRKVTRKWFRLAGLHGHAAMCEEEGEEFGVDWTRAICPRTEGRIIIVGQTA